MTDPVFSVIIVCGHSPDLLKKTLDGLSTLDPHKELEVLVVDDGGYPGREKATVGALNSGMSVRYISLPGIPKAEAWNIAVRESRADKVAFIDDDCVPSRDWLSAFKTSLDDWNVGVVGGPDKAPKDSSIFEKSLDYALTSFFGTLGMRRGNKRFIKYYPRPWNMAARKESIVLSGGFDEDFPEAPEVPMISRMDQIGYRSSYQPDALVWHRRETDLPRFMHRDFRLSMERSINGYQPGVRDVYGISTLVLALLITVGFWYPPGSRLLMYILTAYLFAVALSGIHSIFTTRTPAAVLVVPVLLIMHHIAHLTGYIVGKLTKKLRTRL